MGAALKMDEAELIRLMSLKEVSALGVLYDRYAPALYGTILKLVKDEATASIVLQKTFQQVWMKCKESECSKVSLFAWMLNLSRDNAMAILNQRLGGSSAAENVRHYRTIMGNVLTAVNFT